MPKKKTFRPKMSNSLSSIFFVIALCMAVAYLVYSWPSNPNDKINNARSSQNIVTTLDGKQVKEADLNDEVSYDVMDSVEKN